MGKTWKIDGKQPEWRNKAHEIITEIAKNNSIVVSDMVVTALEEAGLGLDNYSALGGVFTRAAKAGLITKTDIKQQSTRERSNSAKTIWRSLVYARPDDSPDQVALTNMIWAALDFNAETIRLASIVYAGGKLTPGTYLKVLKDFRNITDKYQAHQSDILGKIGQER